MQHQPNTIQNRTLYIFDFDDTLVKSGAQVHVTHADGSIELLSSEVYATYTEQPGDEFDFKEFDVYPPSPEIIPSTMSRLHDAIQDSDPEDVVILTARKLIKPVAKFLKNEGVTANITMIGVGHSDPAVKGAWVARRLNEKPYTHVQVYEDSAANIAAIQSAVEAHPNIKFSATRVHSECMLRQLIKNLIKGL